MAPAAAQVIPLVEARALDRVLDYAVPAELDGAAVTGALVACPLGRRRVLGVVVGRGEATHEGRLAPLAGVVDTPPVAAGLLELALWMARYYLAPRAACLRLVLPPGADGALRRRPDGSWALGTLPARARRAAGGPVAARRGAGRAGPVAGRGRVAGGGGRASRGRRPLPPCRHDAADPPAHGGRRDHRPRARGGGAQRSRDRRRPPAPSRPAARSSPATSPRPWRPSRRRWTRAGCCCCTG